jgi:hypothetical protein
MDKVKIRIIGAGSISRCKTFPSVRSLASTFVCTVIIKKRKTNFPPLNIFETVKHLTCSSSIYNF